MKIDTKYLYGLLPAYYRVLDSEQEETLKAFIEILAREGGIVENNITQLYENWFIETCDEWVVPYIGDLLGVKGVHEIDDATVYSRRAYVANTLSYRRRKGTAPVLEQLALDITGWRSKVVEFFQLLTTSQHLNHVRLHSKATPDMRNMNALDLVNTAFDNQSHTIDVRRIATGLGKYNIQNIGLYLWRLQSYPLNGADARKIEPEPGIPNGCYTFSALGLDTHLFNKPQTESDIVHLAEEINVPGLLRRRVLHDELENARKAIINNESPVYQYFDEKYPPVFQLFINGDAEPVPTKEIVICNLSTWHVAPTTKTYKKYEADGTITEVIMPITAAVDPVLGRIIFVNPDDISTVSVNYNYGFSGDVGGGPYDRKASLADQQEREIDWHVGVSKDHVSIHGETIYQTIGEAINEWNGLVNEQTGLITIMDNRSYKEDLTGLLRIRIPEGKQLFIVAADWPEIDFPGGAPGEKYRKHGMFHPEDLRPHVWGDIEVEGTAPTDSSNGGGLVINGLLVEGKMMVLSGNLNSCSINHCTLVPYMGGLEVEPQQHIIHVALERSICGTVNVAAEDAQVRIEESIIDFKAGNAVSVPVGQLTIQKSTILGAVEAQSLDASNSIFNDLLNITRRQIGCIRFSYLPDGSNTPRRYRCQPELEILTQINELKEISNLTNAEKQAIKDQILNWLFPVFNAISYGHHAYGQLGIATPIQITTGADNASEMGVFSFLQQPQREANLKIVLEEYLRLGLEAGIIYIT
jgi:P2-related tail formation protein